MFAPNQQQWDCDLNSNHAYLKNLQKIKIKLMLAEITAATTLGKIM
jgi:hypothetical protein